MPGASWLPALNSMYDGRFCEQLRSWQDEGMTLDQIGERILTEKGIRPSTSALQRYASGDCA